MTSFPFTKDHTERRSEAVKWQQGNAKYEVYAPTLDTAELSVLVPHCIETKNKVRKVVSNEAHLGPSYFKVFARTLSITLAAIWSQLVQDQREDSAEEFDATLQDFIGCHATAEDRHDLVAQLMKPTKPRNVTVQAFYYRLRELNEYVSWLPGEAAPLDEAQFKKAFYDGMPEIWKQRIVNAGQSQNTMRMQEVVR